MDSSHKEPVTRKMFPFDDVIMHPSIYNHTAQQQDTWTLCIISDMDFGTNIIRFFLTGAVSFTKVLLVNLTE